jgi:hypothetical protein
MRRIRRGGLVDGLVFEVPAFPALRRPQAPGPFRAAGAHSREDGAAGDEDRLDLSGVDVGAAQLDGPDAPAAGFGEVLDGGCRQRHRQPLRSCGAFSHWLPPSRSAC